MLNTDIFLCHDDTFTKPIRKFLIRIYKRISDKLDKCSPGMELTSKDTVLVGTLKILRNLLKKGLGLRREINQHGSNYGEDFKPRMSDFMLILDPRAIVFCTCLTATKDNFSPAQKRRALGSRMISRLAGRNRLTCVVSYVLIIILPAAVLPLAVVIFSKLSSKQGQCGYELPVIASLDIFSVFKHP